MQRPSLDYIINKTTTTLKRFPFALASAIIVFCTSIFLSEITPPDPWYVLYLFKLLMVAVLGIPLFTCICLIGEREAWGTAGSLAASVVGILMLALYYFYLYLPNDLENGPAYHLYRYALYFIGLHLLVAVGPYWKRNKTGAFWQYNKTLFLRILTAILFSGVLFAGLSIALVSIDVLLGVTIDEKRYFQLFVFIGGIFNTWFFLAGIPRLKAFNNAAAYPKGLKIFTQNILIPLVVIYLAILYVYAAKIALQWAWPEGWVAILVLSFSIAGILALLLLHPIRNEVETRWIKKFSTGYFRALVPLVGLLMLAIYRRILEYGITINRYFVLILALWLAGIVIYFIFRRAANIKVIPGSLCILAFFISFGPWGVFSVSERSQVNRLQTILEDNSILKNGEIQKASDQMTFNQSEEISNVVRYLNNNHGTSSLQPWFEQDLSNLTTQEGDSTIKLSSYEQPRRITELMGIEYVNSWENKARWETKESEAAGTTPKDYHADLNGNINVRGVNWIIQDGYWAPESDPQRYDISDGRTVVVESKKEDPYIHVYVSGSEQDRLTFSIGPVIEQFRKKYPDNNRSIPLDDMMLKRSKDGFSAVLYLQAISWIIKPDSSGLESLRFNIGVK